MVRAATMLVGEGAVQGPLGGVWSERRVSCVLAAADVLATGGNASIQKEEKHWLARGDDHP